MDKSKNKGDLRLEAEQVSMIINKMTLFTRRTLLSWLPEIIALTDVNGEQFSIMFELHIEPDQNLKTLAQNLMAAPPNISVAVQNMVEKGWITRITDPTDRRRILLRLSSEGERLFSVMEEEVINRYQEYLLDLPEEVQEELAQANQIMLSVISKIETKRIDLKKRKG